jgi:hypothetical protein
VVIARAQLDDRAACITTTAAAEAPVAAPTVTGAAKKSQETIIQKCNRPAPLQWTLPCSQLAKQHDLISAINTEQLQYLSYLMCRACCCVSSRASCSCPTSSHTAGPSWCLQQQQQHQQQTGINPPHMLE